MDNNVANLYLDIPDMKPEDIFTNKKWAMEIEDSRIFDYVPLMKRMVAKDPSLELMNEERGHPYMLQGTRSIRPGIYNDNIIEWENLHKLNEEAKKIFTDFYNKRNKESFPIGYDGYTSGGNHIHIFFKDLNTPALLSYLWSKGLRKILQDTIYHTPLYAKIYKKYNKFYFLNRHNCRAYYIDMNYMPINSKGYGISLKTSYTSVSARNSRDTYTTLDDQELPKTYEPLE